MRAYDIMTRKPDSVARTAPVREALELIVAKGVSGLTVLDDEDRLVGIITEYALLELVFDPKILDMPISQYMTRDVIYVEKETPVRALADLLILHRIRRLPVVADGRLVGLVTRGDVLRNFARKLLKRPARRRPASRA